LVSLGDAEVRWWVDGRLAIRLRVLVVVGRAFCGRRRRTVEVGGSYSDSGSRFGSGSVAGDEGDGSCCLMLGIGEGSWRHVDGGGS
jgi:hypothetical protein